MAHELCFVNGKAQAFTVGEKSWHGLEDNLDRAPSYDEAMAKYGLDYPLELRPYYLPDATAPAGFKEAGTAHYVARADTNEVLGSVSMWYEIVTNGEAFAALRPLVDGGLLTLETGGVLRKGADAWLLGRWNVERMGPVVREVFADEVVPFSAVMANHNGRRGILLGNTPIRVVCANTLGAAETDRRSRWESIAHCGGAKAKLAEAAERVFQGVIDRYETIAAQYRLLKGTTLTTDEFGRLVLDAIAPDPRKDPKFNPEAKLAGLVLERADKKRETITHLWAHGKGHTGEPNAWYGYNAAVEAIDHHDALWQRRDGSWQSRGLMATEWTRRKNRVLDNLVAHAQAASA